MPFNPMIQFPRHLNGSYLRKMELFDKQWRMPIFPRCGLLNGAAERDQGSLPLKSSEQADAGGSPFVIESVGQHQAGMTRKVCHQQLIPSEGGRHNNVEFAGD